jgi:hypothetical protein
VIAAIVKFLTGGLVDRVIDLGEAYFKKEIDRAEFESRVKIAAQDTAAKVEQSWAEASAKIAASTQDTLKASPVLQRAFAAVLFIQLFVLVWHQLGASAYQVITGTPWPAPMASIEWAYLLIGAMVGAGPFVFKR